MAKRRQFHEDLSHVHEIKPAPERSFGLVFATVFTVIGLYPLARGDPAHIWAVAVAALFLAAAVVAPGLLKPLNRIWFRLGLALHRVVSPTVMAVLFYLTVTPVGLLMRLFGKDPLRLRFDAKAESYWIVREPPGPDPETMRNQF